jgi:hypothetical protein
MAESDPDTVYGMLCHSGKYVFSIAGKPRAQAGHVPQFSVPIHVHKRYREIQKHMHTDNNRNFCLFDDICLFKRIYS